MNIIEKKAARMFREDGLRVWRDGMNVTIAVPGPKGRLAVKSHTCSSAPVAKMAVELHGRLNLGGTPLERLKACIVYAEAAPHAAARRMGRRHG